MDSQHPLQSGDQVPAVSETPWRAGQPAPDMNTNPPVDHYEHPGSYEVSLHIGHRDNDGFEQEAGVRALRQGFQIEDAAEGNNG